MHFDVKCSYIHVHVYMKFSPLHVYTCMKFNLLYYSPMKYTHVSIHFVIHVCQTVFTLTHVCDTNTFISPLQWCTGSSGVRPTAGVDPKCYHSGQHSLWPAHAGCKVLPDSALLCSGTRPGDSARGRSDRDRREGHIRVLCMELCMCVRWNRVSVTM